MDWNRSLPAKTKFEPVDLAAVLNDKVTQIFQNEYLSPRSPFVSLAQPKQGIGAWCDFKTEFKVDDAGLRAVAARNKGTILLPNGVPIQLRLSRKQRISRLLRNGKTIHANLSAVSRKIFARLSAHGWFVQSNAEPVRQRGGHRYLRGWNDRAVGLEQPGELVADRSGLLSG